MLQGCKWPQARRGNQKVIVNPFECTDHDSNAQKNYAIAK
jgi:hypothetical protein